jgi:thiol-disulfide isomerase/thioredoxin
MRHGLWWVSFSFFALVAGATQLPLTAKDVSLMLRAGYSSSAVAQELSVRRFADTLDSTKESMLIEAGAPPAIVNALKSGTYSVPAEEVARAKEQMAAQADRRAIEAEKSRKFNTLYQSQLAHQRASDTPVQKTPNDAIYRLVKGDLVQWHNGVLARFDDSALEKKRLFLLYFSAHWCPPCRKLTPALVDYYNHVAPQHPEFELIFVSSDKSPFGMETYMRDTKMPWPAIDYQKVDGKDAIKKYAGEGIPDLVLVDASGKVISDSYEGKKYLGPAKVITDLDAIFAGSAAGHVALSR